MRQKVIPPHASIIPLPINALKVEEASLRNFSFRQEQSGREGIIFEVEEQKQPEGWRKVSPPLALLTSLLVALFL